MKCAHCDGSGTTLPQPSTGQHPNPTVVSGPHACPYCRGTGQALVEIVLDDYSREAAKDLQAEAIRARAARSIALLTEAGFFDKNPPWLKPSRPSRWERLKRWWQAWRAGR